MSDSKSNVVERMAKWTNTANCWCAEDNSPARVYCTVCEIMYDAIDEIELLESALAAGAFDSGIMSKEI